MLLTAQAVGAINYPTYKPSKMDRQAAYHQQQMCQAAAMQHTTAQEESLTPMLNEDGSAVQPYAEAPAQAGAPTRRGPNKLIGNPGDNEDGEDGGFNVPLGAVPFAMMLLLAGGYAGIVALRRRKAE